MRRIGVVICAVIASAVLAQAALAYVDYGPASPTRISAGQGWSTSGYNARTYNWTSWDNPWGGAPQMGTNYYRTDGTSPGYVWSNTGDLYDDRDIAYGRAVCNANAGNNYDANVYWCETS